MNLFGLWSPTDVAHIRRLIAFSGTCAQNFSKSTKGSRTNFISLQALRRLFAHSSFTPRKNRDCIRNTAIELVVILVGLKTTVLNSRLTGGEPLFTHWVCGEYMVGSETKYPAWTHRVHFDYFYNSPPICPPKYPPGTC
jgi:hypothetical protein